MPGSSGGRDGDEGWGGGVMMSLTIAIAVVETERTVNGAEARKD